MNEQISSLDTSVRSHLLGTLKIKDSDMFNGQGDYTLDQIKDKIDRNLSERNELLKRLEFVDQLIVQIEKQPHTPSDHMLVTRSLLEIVQLELGLGTGASPQQMSHYSVFLTNLSVAIRTLSEPIENAATFVETYTNYSTVLNPKNSEGFRAANNYLNNTKPQLSALKSTDVSEAVTDVKVLSPAGEDDKFESSKDL